MNKCLLLLKIQLLGFFGINRMRYSRDKKTKQRLLLVGIGMISLCVLLIVYIIGASIGLVYLDLVEIIPPIMLIVCSTITLIFTFLKSNGVLFGFRDYDMVMSLPVSSGSIIASRLLSVYITNFLFTAMVIIPSMIVYSIASGAPLSSWVMIFASLLLIPILPIIIAMIVGALITAFSIRFKHSNIISIILSCACVIAIIVLSTNMSSADETTLSELSNSFAEALKSSYPPAAFFGNALNNGSWLSFGWFTMISILPAGLFILILSKFYTKINSALFSHQSQSNYKLSDLKISTPFWTLVKKEMHRLLSCPTYFLNAYLGIVMMVVFSIALIFIDFSSFEAQLGITDINDKVKIYAPLFLSLFIVLGSTTSVSLNLEGKSRWIPFSMPIEPIMIFKSKIGLNLLITIPPTLICSLLFMFQFKTGILETIYLFVIPIIYVFFNSLLGMICNIKFPKYDWTSEYHAVKNAPSALVSTLLGMLTAIIPLGISLVSGEYAWVIMMLTILIISTVTIMMYQYLRNIKGNILGE